MFYYYREKFCQINTRMWGELGVYTIHGKYWGRVNKLIFESTESIKLDI